MPHRRIAILETIRSRLAGMTVAGGYAYDSQGAYTWMLPAGDVMATPLYVVADVAETVTHKTPTIAIRDMTVVVQALVAIEPGLDPSPTTVLGNVLADMERALEGSAGRAALDALPGFVDIRLQGTSVDGAADVGIPAAILQATFTVHYRTTVGSPES